MPLVRQFEQLWNSCSSPPDVFSFLKQQNSADSDQWLKVLLTDQQRRWQTEKPLQVEDYLAGLPDLMGNVDWKLQLAIGEFEARRDTRRPLSVQELSSRFPDLSDTLRDRLKALSMGRNGQPSTGNDPDALQETVIQIEQSASLTVTYLSPDLSSADEFNKNSGKYVPSSSLLAPTEIDQICDEFEALWRDSGETPRLEDFLEKTPGAARAFLLADLLKVELWWRRKRGQGPKWPDYEGRFPEHATLVKEILSQPVVSSERQQPRFLVSTLIADVRDSDPSLLFHVSTLGDKSPASNRLGPGYDKNAFTVGQTLNERYRLESELGAGGMGRVFSAHDLVLSRNVALKVILARNRESAIGGDSEVHSSFIDEARLGANLTHPRIAAVLDHGIAFGQPFTVFQHVSGTNLRKVLRDRMTLDIGDVRRIIGQLAEALDYAHFIGIVHRDLKPENIMISQEGDATILDLGVAKRFHNVHDWRFAGTPAYSAPEQIRQLPSDGRTDQYALALISYEAISGRRPFQASGVSEILSMHLHAEPPILENCDREVAVGILRAMSKDPRNRFSTCIDFAIAIGCRNMRAPVVTDEALFEGSVILKGAVSNRSFSTKRVVHLCAFYESLWIADDTGTERIPYGSISENSVEGRLMKIAQCVGPFFQERWVAKLRDSSIDTVDPFWLHPDNTRREMAILCKDKHVARSLAEIVKSRISTDRTQSTESPTHRSVVPLLNCRPPDSVDVLGKLTALGDSEWSSRMALLVRAAQVEADGVCDFVSERIVEFDRSRFRSSGVAFRVVTANGRLALALEEFRRHSKLAVLCCLCGTGISLVLALWFSAHGVVSDRYDSTLAIGTNGWAFAVSIIFGFLKWPQMIRPLKIACAVALFDFIYFMVVLGLQYFFGIHWGKLDANPSCCGTLIGWFALETILSKPYKNCRVAFEQTGKKLDQKRARFVTGLTVVSLSVFAIRAIALLAQIIM